jgi:DNA end-binding protein Ku
MPNDQVGQEAFAVIREAMRGKSMVALARVVLAKRERVIMLQPWDKGLMGTTLRYPYEIRDAKEYFDDIPNVKVAPDMLKLAEHILNNKAADFDPSQFRDHYEEAVVEMLKKKQAGIPAPRERAAARPQNVVNLMDALRRSITEEKRAPAAPKKGRKRVEGQTEMLLPIAGKKGKEAAVKPVSKPTARQKRLDRAVGLLCGLSRLRRWYVRQSSYCPGPPVLKRLNSTGSIDSSPWGQAPCMWARHQRPLLTMVSDTSSY